ncbi:MAG: hypothetical protein DMF90_25200 [Acidobacteria bacterium]|nr:MAG: hypothetical protein DMF90_25200 [Acidobacteriota bacterium]
MGVGHSKPIEITSARPRALDCDNIQAFESLMNTASIGTQAFEAFRADATAPPALTLRGANALDGYDRPTPFDPAADEPTDAYLEGFAFWGITYLDARSWRHYLPRLIDYSFRRQNDPAMVTEALVRSLRPPDRYPPRLGALNAEQEGVVRSFLEQVALGDAFPHLQTEAQQALEEWWLPNARSRPTAQEIAALRAAPVAHRIVVGDVYLLSLPETLTGSGTRTIPQESRRVETWGGYLCGDAHTVVAVNVTPLDVRSLADSVRARATLFRETVSPRSIVVRGSLRAERLDGLTEVGSPAEPQTLAMVFTIARDELVTLSIRSWPRDDLDREVERILDSFEIIGP